MHPQLMSYEICKFYLTKEIKLSSKKALGSSEILNELPLSLFFFLTSQVHELIFFASHFIISLTDGIITHILARIRMQGCHFLGQLPVPVGYIQLAHTCLIEKTPSYTADS